MFEELQIVNDIVKEFIVYIGFGIAALVGGFIRRKYNSNSKKFDEFQKDNTERLNKMQNCLDTQNERGIRHSEALIDMAEHTDLETARLHPDKGEPKNPIKSRINRNLRDKDGNL